LTATINSTEKRCYLFIIILTAKDIDIWLAKLVKKADPVGSNYSAEP
jgi:hypothetical protein